MNYKFKIGDRVIGVKAVDNVYDTRNVYGTVVELRDNFFRVLFDNDLKLLCDSNEIALVSERPTFANDTILFAKVKPSAIIPSKRPEDGAFDVYACFEESYMTIKPHETKLIPTGLASAFSQDYVAILKERGSTGTKGMGQRAGVIDSGYRGEWFVPITNHNNKAIIILKDSVELLDSVKEEVIIYPYTKGIAQVIMVEVPKLTVREVPHEELMKHTSERGTGALGSSGK